MTIRAVALAVPLSVLGIWWIHQASLVQEPGLLYAPVYFCSVPPVPALVFLLLLVAGRKLLSRVSFGRKWSRRELLFIYMFLVVAVPVATFGILEMLIPWIVAPQYFATAENHFGDLARLRPAWLSPVDSEVVRTMFESAEGGGVPWKAWGQPLGYWFTLLVLFFTTGMAAVALFYRRWTEEERLTFPLLFLPLDMTDEAEERGGLRAFFSNRLLWAAVGLVFVHHALNVLHAFDPNVKCLGSRYYLGQLFTEEPWTAFRPLTFFHRPQMIGFGYFVATDVLLTAWLTFLAQRFVVLGALVAGHQTPGFPFVQEQGTGAFVAMTLLLVWSGRRQLAAALHGLTHRRQVDDSRPAFQPVAAVGTVLGFAVTCWWATLSGMSLTTAGVYLGLLLSFGFVYTRMRAETGVPSMWTFPFNQARATLTNVTGTAYWAQDGFVNLTAVSSMSFLGRGYFTSLMGYQVDNFRTAQHVGLSRRWTAAAMVGALVVGCLAGTFFILRDYYAFGALVLHGGTTSGGYNVQCATAEWSWLARVFRQPDIPQVPKVRGAGAGLLVTLVLFGARRTWLRFPLNPIGYAMGLNYGYCLWGPFLTVWVLKVALVRLGGARLYKQLMPFFLGLALGDLLAGGIMWAVMAFYNTGAFGGYMITFG